ncbi:DUF6126 family protein [Streptomyces ficellus]|uniref:DUF6126 family protein n=1 Tax=Streptomyces ficellus TaxID=1977088 RepID=UPI00142E97E7|nr:DUF6126 family protein [Streptomyces ficellus]
MTRDPARADTGVERGDGRFPRGFVLRIFAYVVAGHVFAAFLYFLFEMGSR